MNKHFNNAFEEKSLKEKTGIFLKRQSKNLINNFLKSDIIPPVSGEKSIKEPSADKTNKLSFKAFFKRQLKNIGAHIKHSFFLSLKRFCLYALSLLLLAVIIFIIFKTPIGMELTNYFTKNMPSNYSKFGFLVVIMFLALAWIAVISLINFVNDKVNKDFKQYNRKNK